MTAQRMLDISPEQMIVNLPKYGNTLSCSIGLGLHERLNEGQVKPGENLLLMGTGAGFSIGAVLIRT